MSEVEKCEECGKAQGYHKLGCTKCVHTNKNGLFGTGAEGQELRVFSPEEHGVLDYNKLPIQTLDIDMRNPPAPLQESVLRPLLVGMIEQDIYKRTAEEQQQRFRDIADLGFTPTYVRSTPEFVGRFQVKELDHYKIQYTVGWDANGSPTEEWP